MHQSQDNKKGPSTQKKQKMGKFYGQINQQQAESALGNQSEMDLRELQALQGKLWKVIKNSKIVKIILIALAVFFFASMLIWQVAKNIQTNRLKQIQKQQIQATRQKEQQKEQQKQKQKQKLKLHQLQRKINPLYKYPQMGKLYNIQPNEQAYTTLKMTGLDMETLLIAKQYVNLGLEEPSNQLILRQKLYYQKKYELQETFTNTLNSVQFPLCIVIPSYNNVHNKRYLFPLVTLFRQEYQNYHVVYVDDSSTDETGNLVKKYIKEHDIPQQKMLYVRNQKNIGSMASQYYNALKYCKDEQIFIQLDGDDGFVGTQVLRLFNHFYQTTDTWFAYGNFIYIRPQLPGVSRPIPKHIIQKRSYRTQGQWVTSQPKSFYNILHKKMNISNLQGRDKDGKQTEIVKVVVDRAVVYPLVQMAGARTTYIPQIVYIYCAHQLNEGIVRPKQQEDALRLIRSYPKQKKLDCLFEEGSPCPKANQYVKNKIKSQQK